MKNLTKYDRSHIFFYMNHGKERREAILSLLQEVVSFHVNRKYCPILDHDSDLRYLLKKGKIVRNRVSVSQRTSYTEIRLKGWQDAEKAKEGTQETKSALEPSSVT